MAWLKGIIKNLPLDTISDLLAGVISLWSRLVEGVPDNELPFYTYVCASVLVLILLPLVLRIFPRTMASVLWVFAVAVLLTPGDTLAGTGQVAPAVAGVAHGILMKDYAGACYAALPILTVFVCLLLVGAIWQILRGVIERNAAKTKEAAEIQEEKRRLAELSESDSKTV